MREIKYRVWDKENKAMVESPQSVANLVGKAITGVLKAEGQRGRYVFLQSTGLKDDHDVEIYESSIIHYRHKDWDEGELAEIVWVGGDYHYPAFDLCPVDSDSNGLSHIFGGGYEVEVIGNVFENPELLQEAEQRGA